MTTNQLMFMIAAEELNFTRAAARACVTQQCLSNHISRLEKQYQTRLFDRTPKKLMLTRAGEELYRAFSKMQRIEENVRTEILSASEDVHGTVIVGMPFTRAALLAPRMIAEYHRRYPNVETRIVLNQTNELYHLLENGKLDFMIATDLRPTDTVQEELLAKERFLLFASGTLLYRHLPGFDIHAPKVSAEQLQKLPLSGLSEDTRIRQKLNMFLADKSLSLSEICTINSYHALLQLAQMHETAFLGTECALLSELFQSGWMRSPMERILAYPVEGLNETVKISIGFMRSHFLPAYATELMNVIREIYHDNLYEQYTGTPT